MTNSNLPAAFSLAYNGISHCIILDISISEPTIDSIVDKTDQRLKPSKALWDTGATCSAITPRLIKLLNLKPTGTAQISTAGGILHNVNTYLIDIYLPNGLRIVGVRAVECDDSTGMQDDQTELFNFVIGMEVITAGDFALTHRDGKTKLSFQIPHTHDIDFVKEINDSKKQKPVQSQPKIGRNDPCPCGSGKKYKNCHGK